MKCLKFEMEDRNCWDAQCLFRFVDKWKHAVLSANNSRLAGLAENAAFWWAAHSVRDAILAPSVALGDFWNYSFLTRADRWRSKLSNIKINDAAVAIYPHWRKSFSFTFTYTLNCWNLLVTGLCWAENGRNSGGGRGGGNVTTINCWRWANGGTGDAR